MTIRKIEAGRVITKDLNTFVGQEGTVFYSESTGEFRLSDGITPGGIAINGAITGLETSSTDTVTVSAGFNFVPATNNLQDIGSDSLRFRDLYLSGNSIYLAGQQISAGVEGIELPLGSRIGGINPGTIVIKGKRDSVELLPVTDVIGDGYIVNSNLWVWSGTEYTDVGQIVGPQGNIGVTGPTGPKGDSGTGTSGVTAINTFIGDFEGLTGSYYDSFGIEVTVTHLDLNETGPLIKLNLGLLV